MPEERPMISICRGPPLCDGLRHVISRCEPCPMCRLFILEADGTQTEIEKKLN